MNTFKVLIELEDGSQLKEIACWDKDGVRIRDFPVPGGSLMFHPSDVICIYCEYLLESLPEEAIFGLICLKKGENSFSDLPELRRFISIFGDHADLIEEQFAKAPQIPFPRIDEGV